MWDAEFGRRLRSAPLQEEQDGREQRQRARSKVRSRSRADSASPTRQPRPRDSVDIEAARVVTRSMARRLRAQKTAIAEAEAEEEEESEAEAEAEAEAVQPARPWRASAFTYDRFIPTHSGIDMRAYDHSPRAASPLFASRATAHIEHAAQVDSANRTYDALLRAELLNDWAGAGGGGGSESPRPLRAASPASRQASRRELQMLSSSPRMHPSSPRMLPSLGAWSSSSGTSSRPTTPPPARSPVFAYRSPRKPAVATHAAGAPPVRAVFGLAPASDAAYQPGTLGPAARRVLGSARPARRVARDPVKVLDAPGICDDYYLNLMDWSAGNCVAVALGAEVFLWDAQSSSTTRLCDAGDSVTALRWDADGRQLAVGLASGAVQLWDAAHSRCLRTLAAHSRRVGVLDWNGAVVSSGSRDKRIHNCDARAPRRAPLSTFYAHTQEVCGLRWSPDATQLASGGNDNLLLLWDARYTPAVPTPAGRVFRRPLHRLDAHNAAVKALAWSPAAGSLLASGGGTDDRTIRLWNTQTGTQLSSHDTKSQVCNIAWAPDGRELVSTHGYSQNHVIVWRYPQMTPIALLPGHTKRVLYLAQSPDGSTVATAAGDETIRFWDVFERPDRSARQPHAGLLGMQAAGRLQHLPGGIARGLAMTAPSAVVLDDMAHVR
ncbi:substrate-specific activator of APC-dependent proteolysis [Coemansia erecta]|uniref:Substrate-specific activator of APC-dependent proteolysis n=1 Tax=Coemansia erecta TaxID=147472 RepID=A0A9W7XT53_9FUNG|nr:substrate-specific activator of APC-dependent proteolysis [Coemansia erecta]